MPPHREHSRELPTHLLAGRRSMTLIGGPKKKPQSLGILRKRLRYLIIVVLLAFGVLVVRLWQLQVVRGEEYFRQTRRNVVDSQMLPSVRGKILDANLRAIADNRPAFNLYGRAHEIDADVEDRLAHVLKLSIKERVKLRSRVLKARARKRRSPTLLLEDQSRDRASLVKQERHLLGELEVRDEPYRFYPNGRSLAHLVGYMNRITQAEFDAREADGYLATDLVGRTGLERAWESYLRGKRGTERFVVNAKGERVTGSEIEGLIEGPRHVPPVAGHNIVLSIDLALQEHIEKLLRQRSAGAVAVVEVDSGRILALASTPSFDPNVMTGHLTRELEAQMLSDPRKPFIDKTLRQAYPPGSTYKFITALAALEHRLIGKDETLTCTGTHNQGGRLARCSHVHQKVNMLEAIQHSCNIYFWKLSERVGMDSMAHVAQEFGFGEPTGLGMNGDTPGRVPTKEWYEERDRFKIGHTFNTAVGQGDVEVGVLQLAMAYAALVNGRRLFMPLLVDRVETASGQIVVQYEPQLRRIVDISEESLQVVRDGMWRVVNVRGGTGYVHARSKTIEWSGKTGTAQVRGLDRREDDDDLTSWHPDRDHAWFAGFAPANIPEISIVVMLEHGGSGGPNSGPIAREIVDFYFAGRAP